LSFSKGDIVWAFGGFPCGQFLDLKLARLCYVHNIDEGEMTTADNGYNDPRYFIYPSIYPESVNQQKKIRARHETINARLKQFNVLVAEYRSELSKHPCCFHAVVNIIQVKIDHGEKLFQL